MYNGYAVQNGPSTGIRAKYGSICNSSQQQQQQEEEEQQQEQQQLSNS